MGEIPVCEPDGPAVELRGELRPSDAKRYFVLPFEVRPGTARIDVSYEWHPLPPIPPPGPLNQTVLDLGLWDEHGYRSAEGFRGWSGSRHRDVFVQGDEAQRGYRPGPIGPGVWHVELGIGAVGPTGASWHVSVRASRGPETFPKPPKPVNRHHVARAHPGWYHGDFHVHAWHSSEGGPEPLQVAQLARAAHLDFIPITEYVVGHHWGQYGDVQEQNPDLLFWPGREIITYFGHVQSLGETPGFIEFRHGFEDIHIRDIQAAVRAAGALFGVNHPTTFPGPLFSAMCRGCAFELVDQIDWNAVDTIEVLTGEALVDPRQLQFPPLPMGGRIPNPFFGLAVDLWEGLLNRGHKITAVCGSDDKSGMGYGTCVTALYASELSRAGVVEAIRAGRAYVRARGVEHSPALEMSVHAEGQPAGTFGSVLAAAAAELQVTVTGGRGQCLRVIRNSQELGTVPITADPFAFTTVVDRGPNEGLLGTWCRIETFDRRGLTTIGNPFFLRTAE